MGKRGDDDKGAFGPLTGPPKRKEFIVLDLESKDDNTQDAGFTRPFFAGLYDGQEFHAYRNQNVDTDWDKRWHWPGGCIDRLMRAILTRKYKRKHIYAHNAGRFDYLFLLPWLVDVGERLGYNFEIVPVASSIQILDVWKGEERWNRWRFIDSVRLIPMSLDKAAKTFGLEGKLEHDLNLHEDDPRWYEYCKQDCVQLYDVLTHFHRYIEDVLCGEVGITAPATAVKLLRRRYLKRPIQRNEHTHDFVRRGYFGGRVEVFRREGSGLRYYDINSSYPAAMLDKMPGSICHEWSGLPPTRFRKERIGFAEVKIDVPESLNIPPLPVRGDGVALPAGKLVFPVGRLHGVWEWSELQQAQEMGCEIVEWGKSYWYEAIPLFEEYVRDLYSYRDKNHPNYDPGLAAIAKLMLNSSYGKFGMKTLRRKIYRYDDPEMPEHAVPADQDPECMIWYADEDVDAAYIMPQIAARVTALARVRLLRFMLDAEKRGGTLHYCDTDSLITEAWMPSTTELGGLKDEMPEQSGHLHGEFLGPKMYMLTGPEGFEQVKAKGMQKRNRETFETLAAGEAVIMRRLEKVGSLARVGFRRGPRMLTVPKRLRLDQGKRIIHADGSTSPYRIDMWKE